MYGKEKIVISFTTYPKRISTIWKTIDSLLCQTLKPDKICLYLSEDQFKDQNSYKYLDKYKSDIFDIYFVKGDLKSHKKYFYALQDYKDCIVITVDDDIIYSCDMVEELILYHNMFPNAVIARRGYVINVSEEKCIMPYKSWIYGLYEYYTKPRNNLFATTGGGTLYPPYAFGDEIFNDEVIMEKCPYADDIWMKVMEIIYGVPVFIIPKKFSDMFMDEYKKDSLWNKYNINMNDEQLMSLCNKYSKYDITDRISDYDEKEIEMSIESRINSRFNQMNILVDTIVEFDGKVVLFGAGKIGHLLLNELNKIGIGSKIFAFASSDTEQKAELKVVGVDTIKNGNTLTIVSVDINNQEEIIRFLLKNNVDTEKIVVLNELQIEYLKKRDIF